MTLDPLRAGHGSQTGTSSVEGVGPRQPSLPQIAASFGRADDTTPRADGFERGPRAQSVVEGAVAAGRVVAGCSFADDADLGQAHGATLSVTVPR